MRNQEKIFVIGHKNPDTDSICSAIAYADIKNRTSQKVKYIPKRAGQINEETEYVLNRFGMQPPGYLSNIGTQIKDMDIRMSPEADKSMSLKNAWDLMMEKSIVSLPIRDREGQLEGLITIGDIAKTYMDTTDSYLLSRAKTQYRRIAETIAGTVVEGNEHGYFTKGKEIDPEFRIWLIEECLSGRMRGREAARRAGISSSAMRKWISLYKMDGPAAFASSNAKRTYSEEIKKKVVKDYLNGRGSFQTLCEKYHLRSPELVNRWVKSYNGHKDSKKNAGGFFMTKRKSTIDERLAAVKEYTEAGKPYEQIARERGFSYRQVYEWVRKYRKFGIAGLEDRRGERKISQTPRSKEEELEKRIAELEHENHLLKLECELRKKVEELERGNR